MTAPLRELEEWCRSPEAGETADRIDAETAAAGYAPRGVAWREPGPDPFGTDWAWAGPEREARGAAEPAAVAPAPARRPLRYAAYAGGAVLAASLLVAAGVVLGTRADRGREVAFAGRVTAREDPARGGGVPEVVVESRSDARAFVTVVGLTPGRRPAVFSREGGQFISVEPRSTRTVKNLPPSFDGAAAVLVVLTATPAGEAVQAALPDGVVPERAAEAGDALKAALGELGFRGAAVEAVRLPAGGR